MVTLTWSSCNHIVHFGGFVSRVRRSFHECSRPCRIPIVWNLSKSTNVPRRTSYVCSFMLVGRATRSQIEMMPQTVIPRCPFSCPNAEFPSIPAIQLIERIECDYIILYISVIHICMYRFLKSPVHVRPESGVSEANKHRVRLAKKLTSLIIVTTI